jgi:alpha-galactosidase
MSIIFSSDGYSWNAQDGHPILEQIKVALCPAEGNRFLLCSGTGKEVIPEGRTWERTAEHPQVTLYTSVIDPRTILLRAVLINDRDQDFLLRAICPVYEAHLSWAPHEDNLTALPDSWERIYGETYPRTVCLRDRVLSPWHLLLWNRTRGRALLAGFYTIPQTLLSWEVQGSAVWKGSPRFLTATGSTLSGSKPFRLAPGRSFEMETLIFLEGDDPAEVFIRYCDLVAQANSVRVPPERFYGVCDWYGHLGNCSEGFIIENLQSMEKLVPESDRGIYVIDAGWQEAWDGQTGDACNGAPWVLSNQFPSGMTALTTRIRQAGMRPGLWWRPLLISYRSNIAKEHPDWILAPQFHKGQVIGNYLDPTNSEVLAWIESEARRFVKEYSIEYLKSDFVTVDMMGYWGPEAHFGSFSREVRFSNPTLTNAQAHRHLWEAIRRGVGPQTLLLGCNTMGPLALGIIDLQRIGDDTSPTHWEAQVAHGAASVTNRFAQNRRWWINDADVVIINRNFNDNQARTWAGFVALTGGLMMFGDRISQIPEHRRAWLARLHDLHRQVVEARPLDFMEIPLARQWLAKTANSTCPAILGVFNWEGSPVELTIRRPKFFIPLEENMVWEDFWSGKKSSFAIEHPIKLGPYESRIWRILH